jgi:hypothetical protein
MSSVARIRGELEKAQAEFAFMRQTSIDKGTHENRHSNGPLFYPSSSLSALYEKSWELKNLVMRLEKELEEALELQAEEAKDLFDMPSPLWKITSSVFAFLVSV